MGKKLYTTQEAAEILGISVPSLIQWAKDGKVKKFKDKRTHKVLYELEHTDLISIKEACMELGISRTTLFRLRKKGLIQAYELGDSVRITASSITKYKSGAHIKYVCVNDSVFKEDNHE